MAGALRSSALAGPLLVTLLLASPASAQRVWPDLKALDAVDTPEITYVDGIPVMVRAIRVKEKPQQLVNLFADTFVKAGLFVPRGKDQPRLSQLPMLTAYDPRRQVSYTVMFQQNADGTTTLLLGESHLASKERLAPAHDAPVPVYPGAREVMTVTQEGTEVVTYRVVATEPELLGFYEGALKVAGFRPAGEGQPGAFDGPGGQLQVTSGAGRGGERAVVVMIRGRAPEAEPSTAQALDAR